MQGLHGSEACRRFATSQPRPKPQKALAASLVAGVSQFWRSPATASRSRLMKSFLFSVLMLSVLTSVGLAEAPRVRFDVPQMVAVRDVTTREFAFVHPQERLI